MTGHTCHTCVDFRQCEASHLFATAYASLNIEAWRMTNYTLYTCVAF
jgi:hypothetical protein